MLLQGWSARLFLVVGIPFCFLCLFCRPFWMHTGFLFFFRVLIHATKKIACRSFFWPFIAHDKKRDGSAPPPSLLFHFCKVFLYQIGRFSNRSMLGNLHVLRWLVACTVQQILCTNDSVTVTGFWILHDVKKNFSGF